MMRHDRREMGRFAVGAVATILGLGVATLPQACTKRLPHGGEDPVYPLRGLHAAVPCEGCHGEGTPKAQSTLCVDCHDADRPDPNHYVGQNCAPCHTEFGWDQVQTTLTYETGAPPTDSGPVTTFTGYLHEGITPDLLCWVCHEVDRPKTPTPNSPTHHYDKVEARRADCGPCHGLRDWLTEGPNGATAPYEHLTRSPHGTYSDFVENPPNVWVVVCTDCHPGSDYTRYDCQTCHAPLLTVPPGHYGVPTDLDPANDASCTEAGCHPTGE